jgi:hypothetical protein
MFKPGTVVILGAGASFEAGLPIGSKLKDAISDLIAFKFEFGRLKTGDGQFLDELRRCPEFNGNQNALITACSKISNGIGFVSSVDNFLEIHASDPAVQVAAKCAIAYLISLGEKKSKLAIDSSNIYNRLRSSDLTDTWYQPLTHVLFEKVGPAEISRAFENVTFVSFNYDRCLEWLLYQSTMGIFSLDRSNALEVLTAAKVYHPYGQIGREDWTKDPVRLFGDDIAGRVASVAAKIRTYTEDASDDQLEKIRDVIEASQTLVFLGFAFHPQNMSLLQPDRIKDFAKSKNIYFTHHKMSDNDAAEVSEQLKLFFTRHNGGYTNSNVKGVDLRCFEFMERFKRTLSV